MKVELLIHETKKTDEKHLK